jgi:hypothetical protein
VPNRPPGAMRDRPTSIDRPASRYTTELEAELTREAVGSDTGWQHWPRLAGLALAVGRGSYGLHASLRREMDRFQQVTMATKAWSRQRRVCMAWHVTNYPHILH